MSEPRPMDAPRRAREHDVWETIVHWRARRVPFVLATVVETRGFTPRKSGARMLIAAGGEIHGTIGGGAIEQLVVSEAQRLLEHGGSSVVRRHLTQELGMCCGGEMSIHLERIESDPRLYVFGAGYIAKPLAAMAAESGFDVTVIDARPDWANAERFPSATLALRDPDAFAHALDPRGDDYVVITTHDHALDQRIAQHLLDRPLRFLGMIGSVPKQRKFALRLRARGFSDDRIARLRTPLGLPIGAATPEEIAVSVMAELIAVRRGAPSPVTDWPAASAGDTEAKPAGGAPAPADSTEEHSK
jgi:xanthine dehydrogenase accessory factor